MTSARVPGHALRFEGGPHNERGERIVNNGRYGTHGPGRARCSCGTLSEPLQTGSERKAWHREHKSDVTEIRLW